MKPVRFLTRVDECGRMHLMNAQCLTIRGLPEDVSAALAEARRKRGTSLNQTVIDLLRQALGTGVTPTNSLGRLGGTWSEEDLRDFQKSAAPFEAIDAELWR